MRRGKLGCELGEAANSGNTFSALVIVPPEYGPEDIEMAKTKMIGRPMRVCHHHDDILGHVRAIRVEGDRLFADFDMNEGSEHAKRLLRHIEEGVPSYSTFELPELDELYEK